METCRDSLSRHRVIKGLSRQLVMTASHGYQWIKDACYGYISRQLVTVTCHISLSWLPVTAACHGNLSWQFVTTACQKCHNSRYRVSQFVRMVFWRVTGSITRVLTMRCSWVTAGVAGSWVHSSSPRQAWVTSSDEWFLIHDPEK